jgi:putative flippase GtrA
MIASLRRGIAFARDQGLRPTWSAFWRRDNRHPLVQVTKYLVFGVLAVVVHNSVFGALGWSGLIPHFAHQGHSGPDRAFLFVLASLAGFLAADVVTYATNVTWVFEGGRHHPVREFLLFTAFASIGFSVGVLVGVREVLHGSGSSWMGSLILVLVAAGVNFVTRKFLVFRG